MKYLIIALLLAGCAPIQFPADMTTEQRLMLLDRMRLTIPPVTYTPIQPVPRRQPSICQVIGNMVYCN